MRAAPLVFALAAAVVLSTAATAADPPTGWNGANPFNCVLQQAGFEETGPDPAADPYCIEFDKTRQNISELGLLDFLAKEPGRVAAAVDKCFYFQSDHWRGSFVQEDGSTKTYEWDGHYFFDKATGDGGAWVTNFNVNGRTYDPSQIPGIPPEYAQHLGPGTGGVITRNAVEADPSCVARVAAGEQIYAAQPSAAGPNGGSRGCGAVAGAGTSRRLGPVALGEPDRAVRSRLGDPVVVRRGFLRYCATGGGVLAVGQPGDRSGELGTDPGAPAILLFSDAPGVRAGRVGPGARARALRRAFPRRRRLTRLGSAVVYRVAPRSRVLVAVRGGRVAWLAVGDRRRLRSIGSLRAALRRAVSR